MPTYEIGISPKSLRETLCVAQTAIANADVYDINCRERDIEKLNTVIAECDRMRPLGTDGTHGDRHTDRCGCEGTEGLYAPDGTPIPAQPKYQLQFDTARLLGSGDVTALAREQGRVWALDEETLRSFGREHGRQPGKTTGLVDAVEQYAQELRDRYVLGQGQAERARWFEGDGSLEQRFRDQKDRLLQKLSQGMDVPPEILRERGEQMSEEQPELHKPNSGKPVDECTRVHHMTFNAAGEAFPAMTSYWHRDGYIVTYCLLCGLDVIEVFRQQEPRAWRVEPREVVIEGASDMAAQPSMTVLVGKDDWIWQKMDVIPGEPDVWRSTQGIPLRADQVIVRHGPLRVLHRPQVPCGDES